MFGTGEVGLRSFSAVCSTLTIPVMFLIGRRLVSDRVGLLAALLTAVNPFLFWYAQEARSYSLLLLLSAVSLLAFVYALESLTPRRLALWGLAGALAIAAHYYAAVLIVAQAAWLAVALALRPAADLDAGGARTGAGGDRRRGAAAAGHSPERRPARATSPPRRDRCPTGSSNWSRRTSSAPGQPDKVLLTALGVALVAVALALLARTPDRAARRAGRMPPGVGGGGVLIAVVVAAVGTDYFDTRNLIATWPALGLLVATGLGRHRGPEVAAGRAGGDRRAGRALAWSACGTSSLTRCCSDPTTAPPPA